MPTITVEWAHDSEITDKPDTSDLLPHVMFAPPQHKKVRRTCARCHLGRKRSHRRRKRKSLSKHHNEPTSATRGAERHDTPPTPQGNITQAPPGNTPSPPQGSAPPPPSDFVTGAIIDAARSGQGFLDTFGRRFQAMNEDPLVEGLMGTGLPPIMMSAVLEGTIDAAWSSFAEQVARDMGSKDPAWWGDTLSIGRGILGLRELGHIIENTEFWRRLVSYDPTGISRTLPATGWPEIGGALQKLNEGVEKMSSEKPPPEASHEITVGPARPNR